MANTSGNEKLVVKNIGMVLSGALESPIIEADTVVAVNGRISQFGREKDCDTEHADGNGRP